MNKPLSKINPAGFVLSGSGMSGSLEGLVEILFAGFLGGLFGFVGGLVVGTFARIFTLDRVKGMIGGRHWAAYGAGVGALALAVMELIVD